jgi:predicted nucleic acid-binding protein
MERFTEKLAQYSRIGLDTSVFIYHLEENPGYVELTRELFTEIEAGARTGITSTITLMEIIVRPLSIGRQDVARNYEALLVNFPHLEIVELDRDVIRKAAQIRATHRVRSPDALQVSACLVHGAQAFISNDRRLERLRDELEVMILDDFIEPAAQPGP